MITRIKQCGLFALSFVLALTACFTVFSNNTYAATAPDIQITNKLTVKDNYGNGEIDISKTWSNAFLSWDLANSVANESKMGITCPASGFSEIGEERWTPIHESFYKARENGYYAVYQSDYGSQGGKLVTVVWSENKSANFKFSYGTVPYLWGDTALWHITSADANNDENVLKSVTFFAGGSVNCDTSNWIPSSNLSKSGVAALGNEGSKIFLSTFPAEYPSDYTGPQVPDSYTQKEKVRPEFTYTVTDKHIEIRHKKKADLLPTGEDYALQATVYKCSKETRVVCNNPQQIAYDIIEKGSTLSTDVPEYGFYQVELSYQIKHSYRYPSYPATPDYEWYESPKDNDKYEYHPTSANLELNGETFTGNTDDDLLCDDYGNCAPPPLYEDCSVYFKSWDFVKVSSGVGCLANNLSTFVLVWLKSLFMSFVNGIRDFFNSFSKRIVAMFSILFKPFQFIYDLYSYTYTIGDVSCAGSSPPGQCVWRAQWASGGYLNFNGSMGIDWGIVEKNYPGLWSYLQWFARLIFLYGAYVYLNNVRERIIQ